jgi:tRNA modification GTPase
MDAGRRRLLAEFSGKKRIIVRNKSDQPARLELPAELGLQVVEVFLPDGAGDRETEGRHQGVCWSGAITAEMLQVMINSRHQDALRRAKVATERTLEALHDDRTLELVAMDLRIAVSAIGEVVGQTTTEDLLDAIFSQFCIGK